MVYSCLQNCHWFGFRDTTSPISNKVCEKMYIFRTCYGQWDSAFTHTWVGEPTFITKRIAQMSSLENPSNKQCEHPCPLKYPSNPPHLVRQHGQVHHTKREVTMEDDPASGTHATKNTVVEHGQRDTVLSRNLLQRPVLKRCNRN